MGDNAFRKESQQTLILKSILFFKGLPPPERQSESHVCFTFVKMVDKTWQCTHISIVSCFRSAYLGPIVQN